MTKRHFYIYTPQVMYVAQFGDDLWTVTISSVFLLSFYMGCFVAFRCIPNDSNKDSHTISLFNYYATLLTLSTHFLGVSSSERV